MRCLDRSCRPWSQEEYIKASNAGLNDLFGASVALDADTLVVGAWDETSAATGIDGNQDDDSAYSSGAAYIFERVDNTWKQTAYLKASNTRTLTTFGRAVAAAPNLVVVGAEYEDGSGRGVNADQGLFEATNSGAAYVFERVDEGWVQTAYLKAPNADAGDRFGTSVAAARDTIVVGARGEDSAATGIDGEQGDNEVSDAGAAYVYRRDQRRWKMVAYVKPSSTHELDVFGSAVALSGDTVSVGAHLDDSGAVGIGGDPDTPGFGDNSGAVYTFITHAAW